MPPWKRLLLNAYYHASYPLRTWNYWRAASNGRLPIIVVYWHRIADDRANPWTVSNAMFVRQIRWLQKHFQFVSLDGAQRRMKCGSNSRPCVSVTFDDGYADNCLQAVPLLIREGIPCTYFVTVRNVLEAEPFSHDLARGDRLLPNTLQQILAMAAAGVEIGVHSYSHADLGAIDNHHALSREIVMAKDRLQRALGQSVRYFAFPYGQHVNLSPAAFALAKGAGYAGVCSAYGGYNFPGDDPFHLQRVAADETMIHLKNWVTMDPRKRHVPRFDCRTAAIESPSTVPGIPCEATSDLPSLIPNL